MSERNDQAGFSLLEILIGITVLIIGVAGLVAMQTSAMKASAYSRHSTEASVLAEDKMEQLRTVNLATLPPGPPPPEQVDAQGFPDPNGLFTRDWVITDNGAFFDIEVSVTWFEGGDTSQEYNVTMRTQRTAQ